MADGKDGEIHWYSPEQRGIFQLDRVTISRSLRHTLRKNIFEVRCNSDFENVIRRCAERKDVWISELIVQSYLRLHKLGFAHSMESWKDGKLVGGLYGVSIGGAFFGESMFSVMTDASKVAFVHLVRKLNDQNFLLLDAQYTNPHLATLGCIEIPREEYLQRLQQSISAKCKFL
jgi:leucyl/phenylalanyl-tRNA---protein transferase